MSGILCPNTVKTRTAGAKLAELKQRRQVRSTGSDGDRRVKQRRSKLAKHLEGSTKNACNLVKERRSLGCKLRPDLQRPWWHAPEKWAFPEVVSSDA